jgi:hypothetical protein
MRRFERLSDFPVIRYRTTVSIRDYHEYLSEQRCQLPHVPSVAERVTGTFWLKFLGRGRERAANSPAPCIRASVPSATRYPPQPSVGAGS